MTSLGRFWDAKRNLLVLMGGALFGPFAGLTQPIPKALFGHLSDDPGLILPGRRF